jgi:uncharacterized protein
MSTAMTAPPIVYRMRAPLNAPASRGATAPLYRRSIERGMIVERDLAVALRDGVRLFVDIYRPLDELPAAPLIAWGPYGKHVPNEPARFPHAGWNPQHMSAITPFEGPDPVHWAPRGYAVVTVNPRGLWYSEGAATYLSPEEAQDFYDVIEWAGVQPWSNGRAATSSSIRRRRRPSIFDTRIASIAECISCTPVRSSIRICLRR